MSSNPSTRRTLSFSDITPDQQEVITALFERDYTLLIAKKGFGKAVIGQTAAKELLDSGALNRVLVIAPPRVIQKVWSREWEKWEHLDAVFVVDGLPGGDRWARMDASDAGICVMSTELLGAFFNHYGHDHGFDGLIIDELTRFKSAGSKGVKQLRKHHRDFRWVVGMSATPVAESGLDIYAQALVVDGGKTLGRNQSNFRMAYFRPLDYRGYRWEYLPGGEDALAKAVSPLVVVAADDSYESELPALIETVIEVPMPAEARAVYDEMANTMLYGEIEAISTAVMINKLQQIANGFVYDQSGEPQWIHTAKFDAVAAYVRGLNEAGENVLLAYWYEAELFGLERALGLRRLPLVNDKGNVRRWNDGELPVMGIHPRSGGHGLNLQYGGAHLVVCAPFWSADAWDQLVGRLRRRGASEAVTRTVFVTAGTVDEIVLDRLRGKAADESAMMRRLKKENPRRGGGQSSERSDVTDLTKEEVQGCTKQ